MADIEEPDAEKGQNPAAVESVTETVPHPADASSAPGPYEDLDAERPPVSTSRPDVPIAQSLVAGAGAPQPPPEGDYREMLDKDPPKNLYVSDADKDNLEGGEAPKRRGRPPKSEGE